MVPVPADLLAQLMTTLAKASETPAAVKAIEALANRPHAPSPAIESLRLLFDTVRTHTATRDRRTFEQAVLKGTVTEAEIIVATYTLYTDNANDASMYVRCCMIDDPIAALRAHNLFVAHKMFGPDPAWFDKKAQQILNLGVPLYPPHAEFTTLNEQLLDNAAYASSAAGAGGEQRFLKLRKNKVISGGAPFLPVTSDESGTQFVDAEQISNHLDHNSRVLYDAINKLNRTVTAMQRDLQETNGKRGGNGNRRNRNGNGRPGRRNDPR